MALGSVNVPGISEQDASKYLTSDMKGVPNGLATLDANGKLTSSQLPDIDHYTKKDTDEKISNGISQHNASSVAHPDIRGSMAELEASIRSLELKLSTDVTQNPFSVTFVDLNGLTVTGVWNDAQARIEF